MDGYLAERQHESTVHKQPLFRQVTVLCLALFLAACTGMPEGVQPVSDFELDRYLGKWYEIARLDHSFERGLTQVTAEYSLRDDGGVRVVNRGFSADKGEWNEAEGKAYFVESPDLGYLKVSFFGPFYGSYVVFELDKEAYRVCVHFGAGHLLPVAARPHAHRQQRNPAALH